MTSTRGAGWQRAIVQLASPRRNHSATRLDDGRVLVAGGAMPVTDERSASCDFDDPCSLASVEILDPDALTSTPVEPLPAPREAHGAVATPGGVLLFGGILSGGGCIRSLHTAVRWDVATGAWHAAPPATSDLGPGGLAPSVTPLAGGGVLVVGGYADAVSAAARRWDPGCGAWRAAASLHRGRYLHAAAALADGRVLVSGGFELGPAGPVVALGSAEIYDPEADTWTETGALATARAEHTLTALPGGAALAIGGYGDEDGGIDSAELWDPATGTWSRVAPLQRARVAHTATPTPDGRVLVIGGMFPAFDPPAAANPAWAEAELYDPVTRRFETVAGPATPRWGHTATPLGDGRVLVIGGKGARGMLASAEIWVG